MKKYTLSDSAKKEYVAKILGTGLTILLKTIKIPDSAAEKAGEEVADLLGVIEAVKEPDNFKKHWNDALDRMWIRVEKEFDLPKEFWEPLEKHLFRTDEALKCLLECNDPVKELEAEIASFFRESETIDTVTLPENVFDIILIVLNEEIENDISLHNSFYMQSTDKKVETLIEIFKRHFGNDCLSQSINTLTDKDGRIYFLPNNNNREGGIYSADFLNQDVSWDKLLHKAIRTANEQYVQSYTAPLFLHKNRQDVFVNLEKLFVLQKFRVINNDLEENYSNKQNNTLIDSLEVFLHQSKIRYMFIEGDAGSGKTSLVAWMNYHYSIQDSICEKIFGERPIITIRLRDIDKKDLTENHNLSRAIRRYMGVDNLEELEKIFPKAVIILDGFDELCMIEDFGNDHDQMLYDLYRAKLDGFHFIITQTSHKAF